MKTPCIHPILRTSTVVLVRLFLYGDFAPVGVIGPIGETPHKKLQSIPLTRTNSGDECEVQATLADPANSPKRKRRKLHEQFLIQVGVSYDQIVMPIGPTPQTTRLQMQATCGATRCTEAEGLRPYFAGVLVASNNAVLHLCFPSINR